MNELMVAIAFWLTVNFGLPAIPTNPKVEFVTSAKIVALRRSDSDEAKTQSVTPSARSAGNSLDLQQRHKDHLLAQ